MRIAHVTDVYLPRTGGIELQVHDLARRQSAWHDVSVFTSTSGPPSVGSPGPRVIRVGRPDRPEGWNRFRSSESGARLVATAGFDLIHIHMSTLSPLGFLAAHHASRRGVPTVVTAHSLWADLTPLFVAADRLIRWGDWPTVWSAVSAAAAVAPRRVLGGRSRVAVLPNGIDPAEWAVAPIPRPDRSLRIAVVGRLVLRKRPYPLVKLLRAARDRLPDGFDLSVDVAGDGPQRHRTERYLHRHGMDWVRLRGRLTRAEIRALYARSDLFVAGARYESFGIAALEARCAGLPILALAGTGVEEFVRPGREGWLVEDDEALVSTIVSLAMSPRRLDEVASHNRSTAPPVSWPGVLSICEDLYREAAGAYGRPWPSPATDRDGSAPTVRSRG